MSLPAMLVSTLLNTKKIAGIGNTDIAAINGLVATPNAFIASITYYTNRSQGQFVSNAVVKSTDGVVWTATGYVFNISNNIQSLIYASGTNTLFATDNYGNMFKSTDVGVSWSSVAGSSNLVTLYNTSKQNNTNGSETLGWAGATVSNNGNVIMFPGVSISYTVYGTVNKGSLYKSLDGGATWTNLSYSTFYMNGAPSKVVTDNAGKWVTVATYGGTFSSATWDYITVSTDNGGTWAPVSSESAASTDANAGYYDVAYGNGMFMACGKGRISYSTNGTTWTKVTSGLPAATVFRSIAYGNGKWVIISPDNNTSYTSTNGTTWTAGPSTAFPTTTAYSKIAFTNGVFAMSNSIAFGAALT